jgi:CRISPR-associated protein Csb1
MDASQRVDALQDALIGGATAVRSRLKLIPAGGEGDKVFPPTYEGGAHATEDRLLDGVEVKTVLLDSVQSQANRLEQALLAAFDAGEIDLPMLAVQIGGYGRVTVLDAPHRAYDAIFRDSLLDGSPFRESPTGQRLVAANSRNATALYELCPTMLLLGGWDSHGDDSGRGAKIPRALTRPRLSACAR